ncbi:HTH-type transcriptional regulator Mce2R [Variovorax sp. WDL1]|nr:putative D-xylose utilization operon transcriptional repressor [Variovorax sp. B2]PNG54138.1 putative D-xylose utilization operon transcriptional repressor [Variovorax sp. B4]VTV11617.1 HTH-type transcriptional regulator Mce2R [Variovorax sp. WDL1]
MHPALPISAALFRIGGAPKQGIPPNVKMYTLSSVPQACTGLKLWGPNLECSSWTASFNRKPDRFVETAHAGSAIPRRNLADRIADHLVVEIVNGTISIGQRLREVELCRTLGVSRVPLREALRILQAQGIVASIPNRGTYVADFKSAETADLLEIRISIERTAFGRLLRLANEEPEILEVLELHLDDLRRAKRLEDRFIFAQADLAFHERVVELSGSPMLTAVWRSLARGVLFFMIHEPYSSLDFNEEIREHERLLELLGQGDPKALRLEISKHILGNTVNRDPGALGVR